CRMPGTRIGSRTHDVGGLKSCQRGSIQFCFRIRQKKNVAGRQADLLTDRAVAGCGLLLTDACVEIVLEQRCHITDIGVREEEPLCLFRTRGVNSQADAARPPSCERWQDIAIQLRLKCPLSIALIPDHSLQPFKASQLSVLIDPCSQQDRSFLVGRARTCFMLNGILADYGPLEHFWVVLPRLEEGRETVFCEWEEDLADKGHRNKRAFDVHEDV